MILFKTEKSWELNVVITWKILDPENSHQQLAEHKKVPIMLRMRPKRNTMWTKGSHPTGTYPCHPWKIWNLWLMGTHISSCGDKSCWIFFIRNISSTCLQVQNLKYISQNCFLRGNFHLKIYSDIKIRNEYKLKWSTLHMWHCLPRMGTAACGLIMQISDHVASRRISQKHRSFQKHRRLG